MKNFSKFIKEGRGLSDRMDFSNDVANPKNIERINAFLGAMGQMTYLVPEHAINKVKESLEQLGLSFGDVDLVEGGSKVSMPLTQFGGRIGKDENGDDINDDGISHKVEGGLSLEIEHVVMNGTHFLKTKIV